MRLFNTKNIFASISLLFLMGCEQKTLNIISQDSLFDRGLEYTKVSSIIYENNTKAIINSTYLNPSYPDIYDKGKEVFLIGIYYSYGGSPQTIKGLDNTNYILALNSKSAYKKTLLTKENKLFYNIPVQNPYSKYYIIEFEDDKAATLSLSLSHKKYGSSTSSFKTF